MSTGEIKLQPKTQRKSVLPSPDQPGHSWQVCAQCWMWLLLLLATAAAASPAVAELIKLLLFAASKKALMAG
jgi:hypothetical protein